LYNLSYCCLYVLSQCYGVLCDVRMFGSSLYEILVFFIYVLNGTLNNISVILWLQIPVQ
jgi:hypothetical protein